jgi:signal transduction histidine kinase
MTTMTAATPTATPQRHPLRRILTQLGIDTAYVLVGFPLAIIASVILITGVALGAGLLIIVPAGVAVMVLTVFAARGFAEVERVRVPPVLHLERVRVRYAKRPEGQGVRRLLTPLRDPQSWLDILHGIIRLPISIVTFSVVFTWWVTAVAGLAYPLYDWALPHSPDNQELPELLGFQDTAPVRIAFYLIVGIVMSVTLPFVVRACALLEAWPTHGLLNGVAILRDQVAGLSTQAETAKAQKAAAVAAETAALRRLERDIHDGPQQRLVRLAVDLGRAQQQFDTDPSAARASMEEALAQARDALDELRTLSRGIAPPILTDRGLSAALAALAARSNVPTELDVPDFGRLSAVAEQTAYFFVAEALTNVNKHSQATRCLVTARLAGELLTVDVVDDGVGGAHVAKGHGLAGLADRLHSAGGELWVSSPDGGPTKLKAEVPCPTAG